MGSPGSGTCFYVGMCVELNKNNNDEINYVAYDDDKEADASALDSFLEQAIIGNQRLRGIVNT